MKGNAARFINHSCDVSIYKFALMHYLTIFAIIFLC